MVSSTNTNQDKNSSSLHIDQDIDPLFRSKSSDVESKYIVFGFIHEMQSKMELRQQIPELITQICIGFYWEDSGTFTTENGLMIFIGSDERCTNPHNTQQIISNPESPIKHTNDNQRCHKLKSLRTSKKRKNLKRKKSKKSKNNKLGLS